MNTQTKLYTYKETNTPYWVVAFSLDTLTEKDLQDMTRWCYNMFGPGLGEYRVENSPFIHRWINDIKWGELRFSREDDLYWFILRWI